jgi:diguanylate cyclase (GGDEF)-like protein/PAS domain S-box-containing protein
MPYRKPRLPPVSSIMRPRHGPAWVAAFARTIRGRILVAFLAMSTITVTLGGYAVLNMQNAGALVRKTFDESLMSINYTRAAATDFAVMRAVFARRWIADDTAMRADLEKKLEALMKTLNEDLDIAVQRSQSDRAREAAAKVRQAARAWKNTSEHLVDENRLDASWDLLDMYSKKVDEQIDLLVNYTAGDGFIYRQSALAAVAREIRLSVFGVLVAIVLSGLVALLLARRLIKPVATASQVANDIATGKLDVVVPAGSADELGALLASMRQMRDNIKSMVERETEQRRSAQTRLVDALESSQEGVVVVDAAGCIALANAQVANFFGVSPERIKPGTPLSELSLSLQVAAPLEKTSIRDDSALLVSGDLQLADKRWLRLSHSKMQDGGFIVVCSDITQLKAQEHSLRQTNLRLDAALDNMSQGLCLFDSGNRLEVVNRRFLEIFGLTGNEIKTGVTLVEIVARGTRWSNEGQAAQMLAEQTELRCRQESGTHYFELRNGRVIASVYSPTSSGGWVSTFEDVTERKQAEEQIIHMARHDALTNLPNRVLFRERIETALDQEETLAVLFIDLDRFKTVNDTLGHSVGDTLLCEVTRRLQSAVGGADTVARLGGDEFAIVQVGARPTDATELASTIIATISEPFDILGSQFVIGASIGIAIAPADGTEPDQLLRNSDMALYRAKANGRGTYHFFRPEMDAQMQARHALEIDLRKAIQEREFELYYQPIVSISAGRKIVGFEALVRWNHPQRGIVGPDEFIPVAEEIGLVVPLGEWVLRRACRDAAGWPDDLSVAVNLSAVQFRSPALALSVVMALEQSGLNPARLELEITETVLLQQDRAVLDVLRQIRQLGVGISMDDFGTGYSSLSYLRSFPFDKIKIDRSFTRELGKREDSLAIIRAVARLGRDLGMATIAEGVETEEQLDIIRAEGCSHAQGYLFSVPVGVKELPKLLARKNRSFRAV